MLHSSQNKHDCILWILADSEGKMKRSNPRRRMGMRYADLNPILGELAREGRIKIEGDMITLTVK